MAAEAPAEQSSPEAAGNRDLLKARLGSLPPDLHEDVLAAWADDPGRTWSLVSALTSTGTEPLDVVKDWAAARPQWLTGAGPAVLAAGAGLVISYGETALGRQGGAHGGAT